MTVFRSRLRPDVPQEYWALSAQLERMAAETPGFVEYMSLTDQDDAHVTAVVFETAEAEKAWRDNVAHQEAQRRGRAEFYEWYDVSVCEELRSRRWEA